LYYFAYGSNMAQARLQRRLASARRIGPAVLPSYRLMFNVASSKDGSAKCNAMLSNDPADLVRGILFDIDEADLPLLDCHEGVGVEYRSALLEVDLEEDGTREALIYLGLSLTDTLQPFNWYKEHVVRGALENRFPEDYVTRIRAVSSIADPDRERAVLELSIYR